MISYVTQDMVKNKNKYMYVHKWSRTLSHMYLHTQGNLQNPVKADVCNFCTHERPKLTLGVPLFFVTVNGHIARG